MSVSYNNLMIFDSIFPKTPSSTEFAASQKEYATIIAIMAYWNLTTFRIKVDRIFNGYTLLHTGKTPVSKKKPHFLNRARMFRVFFTLAYIGLIFYERRTR